MVSKRSQAKSGLLEAHHQKALSASDSKLCGLQKSCPHYTYEGTLHLEKALLDILTSKHSVRCELCPKEGQQQQQPKKKKKKGSGAAKVQKKIDMWVCLTCCGHFCVAASIKANSHSRQHAKEAQHWWAANNSDPSTVYCFKCDREVPVEIPNLDKNVKNVRTSGPDLKFRVKGLPSLGAQSPFNAILQNLLSLKSLHKEMLKEFPRIATLTIALRKLSVMTSWSEVRSKLDQEDVLSLLCAAYPNYRMLDIEESFSCLLDALHEEEKEAWARVFPTAANSTVIESVFGGQCCATVACKECSHSLSEDQRFFYLSLSVPSNAVDVTDDEVDGNNYQVTLENCLKLYTDPEPWICERCTKREGPKDQVEIGVCNKTETTRRVLISVPPPVLALHLKRFSKDCLNQ